MRGLPTPHDLAQSVGKKLGSSEVLFRRLPQKRKQTRMILIPILGDQLSLDNPALQEVSKKDCVIVMAEVLDENTHVWSTRMRSAVFLSAMRHFAKTLGSKGWTVRYFSLTEHDYKNLADVWRACIKEYKPTTIRACECGDWRVEQSLQMTATAAKLSLQLLDDNHFLVSRADFARWAGKNKQLRMELFYRFMRKKTGVLMQGEEPEGGQWNFDEDNRKSFGAVGPKDIPEPPQFKPDKITQEVIADLAKTLPKQPGSNAAFNWAVTREQGLQALDSFIDQRFARFGPTQDAMWTDQPFLFHSLLSVALNLKLISPAEVIAKAEQAYKKKKVDLPSAEGFIRQILGWREFMRGVYWLDMPGMKEANHFGYDRALPKWYWTGDTHMQCMKQAINQTLEHGYAHHIQRLMITGNFALLAGIEPSQVCDWYLAVYVDAVEWVELPNTAGMALYANGGRFTTKPYVASGAYVKRMSNYCKGCRYDPAIRSGEQACPMTTLYWDFLARHADELNRNPRAALMMKNLDKIEPQPLKELRAHAKKILNDLDAI
jgi:deoxyribodipyrimidine photolyase-related protein